MTATIPVTAYDGEMLDALVWRTLGRTAAVVEETLALNPGLAALGPLLPEGTLVNVAVPSTSAPVVDLVQLWSSS